MRALALLFCCLYFHSPCYGTPKASAQRAPLVQPHWKKQCLALFTKKPQATGAWGLLSSGGWSDSGQFFVLETSKEAILFYAKPGSTSWDSPQTIPTPLLQEFKNGINLAPTLAPFFSHTFDGIEYEFFSLQREKGLTRSTQELYMNNPGVSPNGAAHHLLIQQFFTLQRKLASH
jgi:hypothetical protein